MSISNQNKKTNLENLEKYDVVIIGAGVAGCCTARELSKFKVKAAVFEAGLDVADVTTRANSGIVHAGYDPKPGTLKAKYNVAGAKIYPKLAKDLGFPYKQNGALIIAFDDEQMQAVQDLYERGLVNGVDDLEVLSTEETLKLEPRLNPEVKGALYAKTSGICDPYQVAFRNAENAARNGVVFKFGTTVTDVRKCEGGFVVSTECDNKEKSSTAVFAKAVVNAAGLHSDEINNMVCSEKLQITPKRGEYCLFDTAYGEYFEATIFQTPSAAGKGVLVSPTVHGNLYIGPTSVAQVKKDDYSTTNDGLQFVQVEARKSWPELDMSGLITNFSGVRAAAGKGDFIIGESDEVANFFNIAGLESPGLSSAPAIAVDLAEQIADNLALENNDKFQPKNKIKKRYFDMTDEERKAAVEQNPDFGHVICRCRQVTQGEIIDALTGPLPVLSVDALKWRTGATMGRCHGGFCTPELIKFMARYNGVRPEKIMKRDQDSWMFSASREDYVNLVKEDRSLGKSLAEESASKKISVDLMTEDSDATFDVAVLGGGAAGISAAKSAMQHGAKSVVLVDREHRLGGILKQCIHSGFGLKRFNEELTGPEYAEREMAEMFNDAAKIEEIEAGVIVHFGDENGASNDQKLVVLSNTMATRIEKCLDDSAGASDKNAPVEFAVTVSNKSAYSQVKARSIVLSCGSRERGFGALNIAGSRPSGVYTAGCAQNFINLEGCVPGKSAVVLGSGDIGLIMARRMTLSGMKVKAVYEVLPNPSGLRRNIVQCLDDFDIPLFLSHTVTAVEGKERLEAVIVSEVDKNLRPIPGSEQRIECDTLVLSVGLIPESELASDFGLEFSPVTKSVIVDDSLQTSQPGIFACGNALHVHDLVDFASAEGAVAGASAASFAQAGVSAEGSRKVEVKCGANVRYVVPQFVQVDKSGLEAAAADDKVVLSFRVADSLKQPEFKVFAGDKVIAKKKAIIAVPSEMVQVKISKADLSDTNEIVVTAESKS